MPVLGNKSILAVVALIVVTTVTIAYGSSFSSDVNVSIALGGITLAAIVSERLRVRLYGREPFEGPASAEHQELDDEVSRP